MQYTVKSGDTLSSIAQRFLGDSRRYPMIVAANHLSNANVITVGKVLTIPDPAADSGIAAPPPPVSPAVHPAIASQSEQRLAKVHPALATRARAMVELMAHSGTEILI